MALAGFLIFVNIYLFVGKKLKMKAAFTNEFTLLEISWKCIFNCFLMLKKYCGKEFS